MKNESVRAVALEILLKIEQSAGFSHLLIDQQLKKDELAKKDEGLLTEIVYGTVQHQITLDYIIEPFIQSKRKPEEWVIILLRMSVYQMFYLDRVPDHAIINEAVEIAKTKGHKGIGSFVNGVLRNIRRKEKPDFSEITDKHTKLSIETSHPIWLIERWVNMYGYETTKEMAEINQTKKHGSVRIQPLKITREEAMEKLTDEGVVVALSEFSPQGLSIESGPILDTKLFKEGYLTIQDQSSMLASEILNPDPGTDVLDCCSAPGGKTTHIAEKMQNEGQVYAFDLHKKKANAVNDKASALGLTIVKSSQYDARKLQEKFDNETFDRILVDAPCSGFGVVRSKPEIKYTKTESDIENLSKIQLDILEHVAPLLNKTGKLVYSTCTVDKAENEQVIKAFLENNSEYEVDRTFKDDLPNGLKSSIGVSEFGVQIFPQTLNTDGFFISRLKRK